MNFNPSSNYNQLLIQAKAMANLINAQEKELKFYRTQVLATNDAKYQELLKMLESEKEMNAILTEELNTKLNIDYFMEIEYYI